MRVAPLFFGFLVVAVAQCVSAGTYQSSYFNLRQANPNTANTANTASGGSTLPKGPNDPKGPKGPKDKNSNESKDSNDSKDSNESKDSKENNNNHPGFGGKNCASVSIPARVAIQFCGCNDPACPRCPCKTDGEN